MSLVLDPAADQRDAVAADSDVPELVNKIWFHKTSTAVIDADRCVGCGGCIAACPSESIGIGTDGKPTLVRMCTGCSACWDYCPLAGFRPERLAALETGDAAREGIGPLEAAYSASATDTIEKKQDGGAVTALLVALMEAGEIDGAVVTRRLDAFRGETIVATSVEELREAAGSVYHQTNPLGVLNRRLPDGVERIAYVGTPCQINVLRALQRFPWRYRETAVANVTLTIALFCTKSFDPIALMKEFAARGEDLAAVKKIDIREGKLWTGNAGGEMREAGPVKEFHGAALRGCDECADFTGRTADISVGNVGSDRGASTVLLRSDAGRDAFRVALDRGAFRAEPLEDLSGVEKMESRNESRARRSLRREFDPRAPLWITYEEHLENYEGTDRAPEGSPPFRSHHFTVSC